MIGSVVSHYRVVDRLGAGGMGVVYRAEDLRLGRHVALKFLPESATSDPLATERFHREARTTSALNHPNICTLHDVGEFEGRRFIVMELIDGATLDKVLGSGALPVDRVIDISINVADALDAAHSEGILHRDIKPGNIFITRRGQVKVVDFGLAKMMPHRGGLQPVDVTTADQHQLTSAGMAVGTVAYMSPEHARGEAIDQRSDLFSLGVVMYEMATGVQTFKGQTTAVIFDQILNRVPVPPSQINPDVIPTLEQIIGRLLEKDRERRYQFARDIQADLQRLRRELEAGRVLTAENAQSFVPQTWAPLENKRSAQTVAVNVPTFGIEADPAPVPAAWAAGWEQVRPPSKPEVRSSEHVTPADETLPDPVVPPPISRAGAPGAGVNSRAIPAAHQPSVREVGSAPTVMVPASGAHVARPAAPPELPEVPDFAAVGSYVPNASDGEAKEASARREEAAPADRSDAGDVAPTVPAVWTATPPAPKPVKPATAGGLRVALAGAALVVCALAGGLWWMLQGREVPVSGAAEPPPAVAPPAAPAEPSPAPLPPTVTPAAASTTTPTAVPASRPGSPPVAPPTTAARAATPPPAPGAPVPPAAATARPPSKAILAQAATLFSEAQGLLQSGAEADGLAKLAAVRASFAGTPSARDAAVLTARTHQVAKRWNDAATAWLEASRDGVGPEEISEGLIQAADGAARQRSSEGDVLARRTLGEILDRYPASVRALRALQMKMALEDRMKLKEPDAELNGTAPASLLTLRKAARGGGTAPVAEFALWRLGHEYRERRLYDLAASTFTDLGTRFPETRYDAWFSAAELFEKQLKDTARAREAYSKVPAASPRYEAAQKKLTSA